VKSDSVGPLLPEPDIVDLGEVFLGEERKFQVHLRNGSNSRMRIVSVTSGCACTVMNVPDGEIAPREAVLVRGELRGKPVPGKFEHLIHVSAQGESHADALFRIKGRATSRLRISVDPLVLRPDLGNEATVSGVVELLNESADTLTLEHPRDPAPGVVVALDRLILAPGQVSQVSVRVAPTFIFEEELALAIPCRHAIEKAVKIRMKIEPRSGISLTPRQVQFGVLTEDLLRSRGPIVVTASGKALAQYDLSVLAVPAYLRVNGVDKRDPQHASVTLVLTEKLSGFDLSGAFVVGLKRPGDEKVVATGSVPFHGFLVD
jgi:hypothetical protein